MISAPAHPVRNPKKRILSTRDSPMAFKGHGSFSAATLSPTTVASSLIRPPAYFAYIFTLEPAVCERHDMITIFTLQSPGQTLLSYPFRCSSLSLGVLTSNGMGCRNFEAVRKNAFLFYAINFACYSDGTP